MGLEGYQRQVDEWAKQFNPPYWPLINQGLHLISECGEVANELDILAGVKKRKPGEREGALGSELSDILFTIICIANNKGIDLEREWQTMMEGKMYGRDKDRFERRDT